MTLSITAVPDMYSVPPSVVLTVASTTSAPSAVPVNTAIRLIRIHPDGSEHQVITATDPRLIPSSGVWIDYHAPYNVSVTWRVEAAGSTATDSTTLPSAKTWLIKPSDVASAFKVESVRGIGPRGRRSRAARFAPAGGDAIFVSEGKRDGVASAITVKAWEWAALEQFLDDDGVVLVNTPNVGWRIGWMWAQIGQPEFANPGAAWWPYDEVALPLEQSADPDVDLTPPWTFTMLKETGLSFAQVKAQYANFSALKTNTPL